MSFILEDSSTGKWLLGVNVLGQLTTTSTSGLSTTIFLNFEGIQTWQLGVTTQGLLTTTAVPLVQAPAFIILSDPFDNNWEVSVNSQGELQDQPVGIIIWVPNGFGAGTDNTIVGGQGGYMAYPQPAVPGGPTPEDDGQFGPLEFVYNSATATAAGNYFVISNPGRN